jgi:hypothetical protein
VSAVSLANKPEGRSPGRSWGSRCLLSADANPGEAASVKIFWDRFLSLPLIAPRRTAQRADHRATSHSGLEPQPGATVRCARRVPETRARPLRRLRGCTLSALPIVAFARGGVGKDAAAIVNDGLRSWQERRVCYRGREPAATPGPQLLKSWSPANTAAKFFSPRNNSVDGFALPAPRSSICE